MLQTLRCLLSVGGDMTSDETIIFAKSEDGTGVEVFDDFCEVGHTHLITKGNREGTRYIQDSYGSHFVPPTPHWENDWFLQDFLVGGTFGEDYSVKTRYNPMNIPDLWIKFAQLKPDHESICHFASEFGYLGGKAKREVSFLDSSFPKGFEAKVGSNYSSDFSTLEVDSVKSWLSEIAKIKRLFEYWELLKDGEYIKLAELVTFDVESGEIQTMHDTPPLFLEVNLHSKMWGTYFSKDVVTQTRALLHQEVGRELRGTLISRLIWDKTSHSSKIVFSVESLLETIWLQFAQELEGDSVFRRCESCREWFAIRKGERTDRRFCNKNSTCRARVSALRKKQSLKSL